MGVRRSYRARALATPVGSGTKAPRRYHRAAVPLRRLRLEPKDDRFVHGLLVRRSISDLAERAYYAVFAHRGTTLRHLAWATGARWVIEAAFDSAKQE